MAEQFYASKKYCEKHIYLIGGLSYLFGKRRHCLFLTCCLLHNNFTSFLKCEHVFVIIRISLTNCDNGQNKASQVLYAGSTKQDG